jgi:hypothetical protein
VNTYDLDPLMTNAAKQVLGASDSVPFIQSWFPLAIYLTLVVWTPIFAVPNLPPVRADDAWLVVWMLWQVWNSYKFRIPPRGVAILLVLFGALTATSFSSVAINLIQGAEVLNLRQFFTVGIFGRMVVIVWLISTTVVTADYMDRVIVAFVSSMVTSGFVVLVQHWDIAPLDQLSFAIWSDYSDVYNRGFYTGEKYRSIGTIGNPNFLGEFYCVNFACSAYLYLTSFSFRQRLRMLGGLASSAFSVYIVLFTSGSRTALICLLVLGLYMIVGGSFIRRKIASLGVAGVLGCLAILVKFAGKDSFNLPERMQSLLSTRSFAELKADDELLGVRFDMWAQRVTFLETDFGAFFWGVGFANNDLLIADNGFLRLLLQYGIFGLTLGVLFWIYVLLRGHVNIFDRRLTTIERIQALLFAAIFANFFIFEFVADGLVQAKQGCVIPAFGVFVVVTGSAEMSRAGIPFRGRRTSVKARRVG